MNVESDKLSSSEPSDIDFDSGSDDLYLPPQHESNQEEDVIAEGSSRGENIIDEISTSPPSKRKRKGQRNKPQWKRQKNAQMRLEGKTYTGFAKDDSGKYKQTKEKDAKVIGELCGGHSDRSLIKGGPRQAFDCKSITDEDRISLFTNFWHLPSWDSKKVYVRENVLSARPKYRKVEENSKKNVSFRYYLTVTEGKNEKVKKHVCKLMFLNTLGVGEKQVRKWTLDPEDISLQRPIISTTTEEINVQGRSSIVTNIKQYLDSLPKVESHYCREWSDKLYLEPVWTSFREMYREFEEKCNREGKTRASWATFQKTIKACNLNIYTPRKDQCNDCTKYKMGTLDKESFERHIKKKNDSRAEKELDKRLAAEGAVNAYTADLQAVLLSPRLNASANYYKTKLKVHNQTYFDLGNKDVSCYVWHEASGGLESDIFASVTSKFLAEEIAQKHPNKIILWSDGCGYQNRNAKLANALLELSIKNKIIIEQKYLEVGHTQMEVDSVHATIEKKLGKRREVYVPADYLPIIQSARLHNPYRTYYLNHGDFFAFDNLIYSSIRPGKKTGDPCVNDVLANQYTPEGVINFKLSFDDKWAPVP